MQQFRSFLKTFLPRKRRSGDANTANIGAGAQVGQFAQGTNIIQIGTFEFPVRTLLALLGVALVIAVATWWIVVDGTMDPGIASANVAIVEFGAQEPNGNFTASAQGAFLAAWLYNSLNRELADIPQGVRPQIWHIATRLDPIHLFQKRFTTGPIRNEVDAKRVAEQVGANIVIYGNLVPGQSIPAFMPQFYVEQREGEADELSGSQQLGQPIPMPAQANDEYLASTLQPIGRALVWFSRGLQNDLNGRYDLAHQILKDGEKQLQDWDENQGKEVLYYFIGREALFLAHCESDARLEFTPQDNKSALELALDEAEDYFGRAKNIAERNGRTYARATFGLGQVAFQRAQRQLVPPAATTIGQCRLNISPNAPITCPARASFRADAENLAQARVYIEQAIALFEQARAEMPNPAPSRLDAKLRGARATADTFLGQLELLQQNAAAAETRFQNAANELQQLTQVTPTDDQRTLANVYYALGNANLMQATVRHQQNDFVGAKAFLLNAIVAYNACVKMIPSDHPDAFLRANLLPNCLCTRDDAQRFLDGLK